MRQKIRTGLGVAMAMGLAMLIIPLGTAQSGAAAGPGYTLEASDGGIFTFGNAPFLGSATSRCAPIRQCWGFAANLDGSGYWVLDNFPETNLPGSALYGFGNLADVSGLPPGATTVAVSPTGHGGWVLYGETGQVVPVGGAPFYGDARNLGLSFVSWPSFGFIWYFQGIVATPDGGGYWLIGVDGGVFAYGDAQYFGSMGGKPLNLPIAGMARTNDGQGYWLVAYDGGVFAFGDATFAGSMGGKPLNDLMTSIAADPDGPGYWTVAKDGGVFAFGGAPFLGSMGGQRLARPIYNIAATG